MKYLTMFFSVSFMLAGPSIADAQVPPPILLAPPLLLPPGPPPPPPPLQPDYSQRYDPRHSDWCANRYRSGPTTTPTSPTEGHVDSVIRLSAKLLKARK